MVNHGNINDLRIDTTHVEQNVKDEIKYVRDIAVRLFRQSKALPVDDLFSEGWIALEEARRKYNPSKNDSLLAYAYPKIHGAMVDAIRRNKPLGYRFPRHERMSKDKRTEDHASAMEVEYEDAYHGKEPEAYTKAEVSEANRVIIKVLKKRERTVLIGRAAGEPLKKFSKQFGVSDTRIVQINREARGKVRKVLVRGKK